MWARKLKQQHFEQPREFGEFVSVIMFQFLMLQLPHSVYCYVAERTTWDSTYFAYCRLDLSIFYTPSSSFPFTLEHGLVNSGLKSSPIQCVLAFRHHCVYIFFYQHWVHCDTRTIRAKVCDGSHCLSVTAALQRWPQPQYLKVSFQSTMKASSTI